MKAIFEFFRGTEWSERPYRDFTEHVVKSARFVTDDFGRNVRSTFSGVVVVNAQCDDSVCYTQPFKNEQELIHLLEDPSFNGWELTDDETMRVEIGSRADFSFYLRSHRAGEEDFVLQVVVDTYSECCDETERGES